MESDAVRRRMNMLAAHFAPTEIDISPTHLLPMNCSSTLNSIMSRRDNKICFGRQSSASQGFFMRQASITDYTQKQGAEPLFSRPTTTRIESNLTSTNSESIESSCVKDTKNADSKLDVPCFARAIARKQQHQSQPDAPDVVEWSPRMDVAESGRSYILTLEIPGVNANDIRVELNHHKLRIMGKRSRQYWRTNDSITEFHKREILQGPYLIEWPFPYDANKDQVSAEFLDGILQIVIPKL